MARANPTVRSESHPTPSADTYPGMRLLDAQLDLVSGGEEAFTLIMGGDFTLGPSFNLTFKLVMDDSAF